MKLRNIVFGVAIMLVGLAGIRNLPVTKNKMTEEKIRQRTVKIESFDNVHGSQGTGTLIGYNYILTNAHLFPKKVVGPLQVKFRRHTDNEYTTAVIVSSAPRMDFAILRFKGRDATQPLPITANWKLGESLILMGNPVEGDFIVGHSRILGYTYVPNPLDWLRPMIVFACDTGGPGFSGSGIYNLQGEYLGTFELGAPMMDLCFAIPAKEVLSRRLNQPWKGFTLSDGEVN